MCKVIPFMGFMKEVSFIFDIHLPNTEVFCNVFEDNNFLFPSHSLTNSLQERNISPLSIIVFEALYKRRLLGYDMLIKESKQRKFSLNCLTNHIYTKKIV